MTQMLFFLILIFGFSSTSQTKDGSKGETLKLFLAGDVMTGRGVDQALPYSVNPKIYESYVKNARDYLLLAERASGDIETPMSFKYIWGDALQIWKQEDPAFKLINLETSITDHNEPWPGKGIHYRMHPENVEVLTVAGIDHVSLANNHTLDWQRPGLLETMKTLNNAGIKYSGAGEDAEEAAEPAVLQMEKGRVLVYSYGSPSSGVPYAWAAEKELSGVNFLPGFSAERLQKIRQRILSEKKPGDLVIFSVHWGANWGYNIAEDQQNFAHQLIDEAGVDAIFGHSSHHPLGIEVYKNKLVIYGAGDFFNDYEGIQGHEEYRGELTLMYFPEFDLNSGELVALKMFPMEIEKLRLNKATADDTEWLQSVLSREGQQFGTGVKIDKGMMWLEWK